MKVGVEGGIYPAAHPLLPARNLTAPLLIDTGSLRFVVGLNALASGYDANGNMTLRLKDGARYFLAYDAENRLTSVSGTVSARQGMTSRAPDAYSSCRTHVNLE